MAMKRKGQICVLFDEVPPNTTYRKGAYSWVQEDTGLEYIEKGYGQEYDPDKGETDELPHANPSDIPDDFPAREHFLNAGIRDFEDVKQLHENGDLQSVDQIGQSTEQKINKYFE